MPALWPVGGIGPVHCQESWPPAPPRCQSAARHASLDAFGCPYSVAGPILGTAKTAAPTALQNLSICTDDSLKVAVWTQLAGTSGVTVARDLGTRVGLNERPKIAASSAPSVISSSKSKDSEITAGFVGAVAVVAPISGLVRSSASVSAPALGT
jgi:hypothetical protein